MLSVAESAALLHVSSARVRALIAKGTLPAQKIGRVWALQEEDVMHRVVQKPRSGRPRTRGVEPVSAKRAAIAPERLEKLNTAYKICKENFGTRPDAAELAAINDDEAAAFRIAVGEFFSAR